MSVDLDTAGVECPAPMTRAELLALRASAALDPACPYIITDFNAGTLGAAVIRLAATSPDTLSLAASIETTFDNSAWEGEYDIDLDAVTSLHDHNGNHVYEAAVVLTFPWGNAAILDNVFEEESSFTYTGGIFRRNYVGAGCVAIVAGGSVYENQIDSNATLNVTLGNVYRNTVSSNSQLVVLAGNVYLNSVDSESTLTVGGGAVYQNEVSGSSIFEQIGTSGIYGNTVGSNSSLTISVAFFDNNVHRTQMSTEGSAGSGIRYCEFSNCTGLLDMQNVGVLDLAYFTAKNNAVVQVDGAARLYLRYCTLENYGRILVAAAALLDMNYTGLRDYSYVQVLGGRLYANYCTLTGVSYINQAATVTGTNRMDSVTLQARARARFLETVQNCRIYYCTISAGAYIEHRGTSNNCYFYYCTVAASSAAYTDNSVNARIYYCTVDGNSEVSSQDCTGTHYIYYCVASAHGYLRMRSGQGRMYAVHAMGQAVVQLTGGAAASRIYYSAFMAYFYLYLTGATLPNTRHSLFGSGRRSYTPTVAIPANGTYTQNF